MKDILDFILLESDDDFDLFAAVDKLSESDRAKLSAACDAMLSRYGTENDEKYIRFNVIMVQSLLA